MAPTLQSLGGGYLEVRVSYSTRTWQHSLSATRTSYEAWSSKDCVAYAFNLFYNQFISNIVNTHPKMPPLHHFPKQFFITQIS